MPNYSELHSIEYGEELTRNYEKRYIARIYHKGLNKHLTLKDLNGHILLSKIENAFLAWDLEYQKQELKRELEIKVDELKITVENYDTHAKQVLTNLENILLDVLEADHTLNWDALKDYSSFNQPQPILGKLKPLLDLPKKPDESIYRPRIGLFDQLIPSIKKKKIIQAEQKFNAVVEAFKLNRKNIEDANLVLEKENQNTISEHEKNVKLWNKEREAFEKLKKQKNESIDKFKLEYSQGIPNAVIQYCEIVLKNSDYSGFDFPQDFRIDYFMENKTMVVDYTLPSLENMPRINGVKFISSKNEVQESYLTEREIARNFDEVIYKIILRSLYELFESDTINAIEAIVFNGWVNALNKANGKTENACIVSIHTPKQEFTQIDLSKVDPKQCFKGLKGIGGSKLSSITPVRPIMQLNKDDKRFILSQDVAHQLDEGFNLASMEWEDFEHLVREIFEKEFSVNGGEVKVTQSSRDGGVDAIAFDPDPIRGGKIVIQAKRYTNTVGVSAIRDLYGTTLNEGAIKGIIVTTSDYGVDAHNFAKDKPLTLLNGNHLLHLLERHGHKARINLEEAKKLREGFQNDLL